MFYSPEVCKLRELASCLISKSARIKPWVVYSLDCEKIGYTCQTTWNTIKMNVCNMSMYTHVCITSEKTVNQLEQSIYLPFLYVHDVWFVIQRMFPLIIQDQPCWQMALSLAFAQSLGDSNEDCTRGWSLVVIIDQPKGKMPTDRPSGPLDLSAVDH